MKTGKIPAGKSGTLTAKDLSSASMPQWAPTWNPPTVNMADPKSHFNRMDVVVVVYATDADNAAELIPNNLQLVGLPDMPGQAQVQVWFNKFREGSKTGPYYEVIFSIPVLLEGAVYGYFIDIFVTSDAAMVSGREIGGYPKKGAGIDMRVYGDLYLNRLGRPPLSHKMADPWFHEVVSTSMRKGKKLFSSPLPANQKPLPSPYDVLLPMPEPSGQEQAFTFSSLGLRFIPGVGKKAKGPEVLQLISTPWEIAPADIYEGLDPSILLTQSEEDPIAQKLPVNSVLGAYIIKGDMITVAKEWEVEKDYKNQ